MTFHLSRRWWQFQGLFHEKQITGLFREVWSKALNKYLTWLQVEISVQLFRGGLFCLFSFFFSQGENWNSYGLAGHLTASLKNNSWEQAVAPQCFPWTTNNSLTTVSSHWPHLVQGNVCVYVCVCCKHNTYMHKLMFISQRSDIFVNAASLPSCCYYGCRAGG